MFKNAITFEQKLC